MSESHDGKELSFERSEVEGKGDEPAVCAFCATPIRDVYYQVGGAIACAACRNLKLAEREAGSGVGRFGRAVLLGSGAAILGALLWYAVAKLTGYEFGLIAIVIGFLVGGAVRMGSRRRGGWKYQTLAMVLTYTSIVSTYIPAILQSAAEYEMPASAEGQGSEASPASEAVPTAAEPTDAGGGEPAAAEEVAVPATAEATVAPIGGILGLLVGLVLILGIAFLAPFLAGFENFMGWIILAIGLYEAWKLNRREELVFEGPFRVAGSRSTYIPEPVPPPIVP